MRIEVEQSETLSVNYEVQGHGLDVVLVHGLGLSSMKTWIKQVPELSKHFRVHTYDVGVSGPPTTRATNFQSSSTPTTCTPS